MLKILIADDEELERQTIITILDKNFGEDFDIHQAKNGREAIEIADKVKPDLIIMDIKMPGINGITAIKEIRGFLKDTYFIVLTAYDYFEYAKEAIEYGVREYMLKPFKRNEFVEKIKAASKIIEENKGKRHEEIVLKEKIFTLLPMMENELCYSIMNDNICNIDYVTYLGYLQIKFNMGYAAVIRINNNMSASEKINLKFKINEFVRENIKRYSNAISSCIFSDDIVIFVDEDNDNGTLSIELKRENMIKKIHETLVEKYKTDILVGAGNICTGIEKLSRSYQEALMNMSMSEESRLLREQYVSDNNLYSQIGREDSINPSLNKETAEDGRNVIVKAIEYINNNFKKDIMLEEVAAVVNISSFYFSKIFKEYTGKNYVDYITELRIDIAKEKLKTGAVSIKEICYEVGYNDPNYFSRVFKKVEGISPTEYKAKFGGKI